MTSCAVIFGSFAFVKYARNVSDQMLSELFEPRCWGTSHIKRGNSGGGGEQLVRDFWYVVVNRRARPPWIYTYLIFRRCSVLILSYIWISAIRSDNFSMNSCTPAARSWPLRQLFALTRKVITSWNKSGRLSDILLLHIFYVFVKKFDCSRGFPSTGCVSSKPKKRNLWMVCRSLSHPRYDVSLFCDHSKAG